LAVLERHRCLGRHGTSSNVEVAWRPCDRDANRAVARGEGGAERPDLDTGRKQLIADEAVRRRQRQPVHRPARRQPVALCAGTPAILHGACRPDTGNDETAHVATNSAMISPASAARSCSAKALWSMAKNVTRSPGSVRKVGFRWSW